MSTRARAVLVRMAAVVLTGTAGFALAHEEVRQFETTAAAEVLALIGVDRQQVVNGTSIQVFPREHEPFRAVVNPSCSALASLLAIASLSLLAPRTGRGRRELAMAAALLIVAAGNVVRIAASIALGYVAGRASLVLFHDWVGSLFTFAYTLGGYLLLLWLLLPDGRAAVALPSESRPVRLPHAA